MASIIWWQGGGHMALVVLNNSLVSAGDMRHGLDLWGWEDPLEAGVATHSSILACRIPMDGGAWQATVYRVTQSQTRLSD